MTKLESCTRLTSKWHAATGAAAVFSLCTFFLILHLLAKWAFRYKKGNTTTMEKTHHTEMGLVLAGAEAYDQREGQRDISCSPDRLDGFDLVSCTQHGITLHSTKSLLRPKESAFCNPQLTNDEHPSSPPQPVTASSAEASTTNTDRQPRWPFFQDKCALEDGMLSSLFAI